jgi:hypothetical protein
MTCSTSSRRVNFISSCLPATKQRGELSYPMSTDNVGLRLWEESKSILNRACAYVLLALGRASREKGLSLDMPSWGANCTGTFPNGVIITLLNRDVLVLRPLGYKPSPAKALTAAGDLTGHNPLGIPATGLYFLYIGAGHRREHDLTEQCAAKKLPVPVLIDPVIGGRSHDITLVETKDAAIGAIKSTGRCIGTLVSNTCATWSVANFLPDANGRHGQPWRDRDNLLGITRNGILPEAVVNSNLEAKHAAEIATVNASLGGFGLAESQITRRRAVQ